MDKAKPYYISKHNVWESYKQVKANRGAPGVDGVNLADFEAELKNNLYKIWNRMSSGSYVPSPVRRVEIPKSDGKTRTLGIPTVSDRIAQMVVKRELEPVLEKVFHHSSYGYRPMRSAKDAVASARKNCWKYDWVLDIDIKGFFDNIDHDLMMKAVRRHTESGWVRLYIERWLKAPVMTTEEGLQQRTQGTPQGGVISPLLANLFLHYAFDVWMGKNYPSVSFERYADDCICHCRTEDEAVRLKEALEKRMAECRLELHPEKTKIVYCRDDARKGSYPVECFDFLGFTFKARRSKTKHGKYFINFSPAASDKALKNMRITMKAWNVHQRSRESLEELSCRFNAKIRGWINYYGSFYRSAMYPTLRNFDLILSRWAMKKYKRLRNHKRRARHWIERIAMKEPCLFSHWRILYGNG